MPTWQSSAIEHTCGLLGSFVKGISRHKMLTVARLQSEFCTKDFFFEPRIFLRKMLRNFPRNFGAFVLWVRKNSRKIPAEFPTKFPKFPCKKIKKKSPTSFCRIAGRTKCWLWQSQAIVDNWGQAPQVPLWEPPFIVGNWRGTIFVSVVLHFPSLRMLFGQRHESPVLCASPFWGPQIGGSEENLLEEASSHCKEYDKKSCKTWVQNSLHQLRSKPTIRAPPLEYRHCNPGEGAYFVALF